MNTERLRDTLAEWPHTPLLINAVSMVLPAMVLVTLLSWWLIGNPLEREPVVNLAWFLSFLSLSLPLFFSLRTTIACRLSAWFLAGTHLFPNHALLQAWCRTLDHLKIKTRPQARLDGLLRSSDAQEVEQGVALAKRTRHWHAWSQRVLHHSWDDDYPTGSPDRWEVLLRAGALSCRYNENFLPLTFLAWRKYYPLSRGLLDAILAAGAHIDDIDPSGRSLLDLVAEKAEIQHCTLGIMMSSFRHEDFEYLLTLGATPTRKTIALLKSIHQSPEAEALVARIESGQRREALGEIANSSTVIRALDKAVRAL